MSSKQHWEHVYSTKPAESVSWYQRSADLSLRRIKATGLPGTATLIDVGGGASTLVDGLLAAAYSDITVLDMSATALHAAQARLARHAGRAKWIEADITEVELPASAFDLWHDRAVFHFLVDADDRRRYVQQLTHALKPGGHAIIATFAEDGPAQCSGLPVMRYRADGLAAELGEGFDLSWHQHATHHTPFGTTQQFMWCGFRKHGA